MRTFDLFSESCRALTINKIRSGLTMLGIVIGIASVITMISIGQGAQTMIQSSIEGLGSNLLTVMPGVIQPGRGIVSSGRGAAQTLKNSDIEALKGIPGVAAVSPESSRRFQIVASTGQNTNSTVIGVLPAYEHVRSVFSEQGSFVADAHNRSMSRVAVLGPTVAQDLFGDANPIDKTVRINKVNFKVIGVLKAKGTAGFFNPDDTVFVPLSTMQKILAGADFLSLIALSVEDKDQMPRVQEDAHITLAQEHGTSLESPDFSIVSQADILGALTQITVVFTLFLASIAGISLLVGGIGIMNMMLTTVTERTREIGLRKAIGARNRDIIAQFLLESVLLTVIGGLIGVAIGIAAALVVRVGFNIAAEVSLFSILLAGGVSTTIGVLFGFYPAWRAARLNPIEALRYE
ncbi:ABC transporter permease [Candidatus Uhrbacteria bacterium]|nr:ABC transporter permease [Candidatus Uhrbacteria bacterium]